MKGDRKRVIKEVKAPVLDIAPINQMESATVQNLFNISQAYAKLKQQHAEYDLIVKNLTARRTEVQKGSIALPILMPLSRNKFYNCNDKVHILKELDNEIRVMTDALKGVEGQLLQHRDAFIEAGLAAYTWTTDRFSQYKPKNVYAVGCQPTKDETVLFEAEMEDILKDKDTQKKLIEAVEIAKEKNKSK